MSDKQQENASETTQLPPRQPGSAAKSRTLVVSIASFSVLIAFTLWTLFRTDFTTYPNAPEIDIVEITKAPDSLIAAEDISTKKAPAIESSSPFELLLVVDDTAPEDTSEEPPEQADTVPEESQNVAVADSESLLKELQQLVQVQQRQIDALKIDFGGLEEHLAQREVEIAVLNQELEIARLQPVVVTVTEPRDDNGEAQTITDLNEQNEQLQKTNSHLEQQLAEVQQYLRASQDVALQNEAKVRENDAKVREADARVREMTKRQDELAKRQDLMLRERAQLEDKISQQQAKLTTQERSFQELANAIKSHKQVMKQMDQARMELAAELDVTKNKYAKLLQAVSARNHNSIPAHDTNAFVAVTTESRISPPSSPEQDVRYHVIGKGDTLTSISRHYYGTAQRWHEVYEANKAVLTDQNRLKVGLVLVIP